ncbi:MAG: diaminobutyrate acetyltransferase, partial [Salinisphaera sp.]|nr:diaminobutyrate acetyltransferase [Salinisphaera sp.]
AAIWQLVRDTGVLDENSAYASLLVAEHFAATSVVAEAEAAGAVIGFISAYCPPTRDDTVFVWQVGVAEAGRGRGLATRMLVDIVNRDACTDVHFLDTTIGPSNEASMALFRGFARRMGAEVVESELFTAGHFPPHGVHEPEILFRIGPFTRRAAN